MMDSSQSASIPFSACDGRLEPVGKQHLILHRDIYGGLKHATAKEWFDYISAKPSASAN